EPYPEFGRDRGRAAVDVEEDLDVVGDEADRDGHDVVDAAGGELREVLADVRPSPRFRRSPGGLVRPRPAIVGELGARGYELCGFQALPAVRVAGREQPLRQAVRAEDDLDAVALVFRPARDTVRHTPREPLDASGA